MTANGIARTRNAAIAAALFCFTAAGAQQPEGTAIRKRGGADAPAPEAKSRALDAEAIKQLEEGAEKFILQTSDGVYLAATYWRAKGATNNSPVVVLLHGRGQTQRDWYPFAKQLNERDFAVVTFDFRGHGDSRDVDPELYKKPKDFIESKRDRKVREKAGDRVIPQGSRAVKEKLAEKSKRKSRSPGDRIDEKDEFRNGDEITRFCVFDLEAIKHFLLQRNNNGELNVRNLGVVASDLGASVLVRWMAEKEFVEPTRNAWSTTGGDLNALVLVSPQMNYGGYTLSAKKVGSRSKTDELAVFIVAGNDPKSGENLQRAARLFGLPEYTDKDAPKQPAASRGRPAGSMALKLNSKLTGTKLFNPPVSAVDQKVIDFLAQQLSNQKARGWERRELDVDMGGFGSAAGSAPAAKRK